MKQKNNRIRQVEKFASYLVVGGGATIVEWAFYWLFIHVFRVQYMIAAALAIIISTFSNWLFGRLLTFRHAEKQNIWKELGNIYLASIVGMLGNILLMWLLHGKFGIGEMKAKMMATGIVFAYNYFVRTLVIYRK